MFTCKMKMVALGTMFVTFLSVTTKRVNAQEVRIVSPNIYADTEAPSFLGPPGGPPGSFRVQQLYEASDFASLPGPQFITQFAYRPDGDLVGPSTSTSEMATFRLSTTNVGFNDVSPLFADNIGSDETVVLEEEPQVLSTANIGPAGGPKEFDYIFALDTPFLYDPGQGNLLLDFTVINGVGLPADVGPSTTSIRLTASPPGAMATAARHPIVTEFTFVPGGDFDFDGDYDCPDVDGLVMEIVAGTHDPAFDLTGDGVVDGGDLTTWLTAAGSVNLASGNPYLLGDATLDGTVDVSDFNLWNTNKFTSIAAWCSGDFNADGAVDVSDFSLWNENKFTSSGALTAVPEPTYGFVALLVFAGIVHLRRRRVVIS